MPEKNLLQKFLIIRKNWITCSEFIINNINNIEISLDRWTPPSRWSPSEKVQIFNTLGVEVWQSSMIVNYSQAGMPNILKIDVSDLPAGV